jgi:uncharacterized low-complexity protein
MKRIVKIAAAASMAGALAMVAATPSQARHSRHAAARTAHPYNGHAYDYAPRSGSFGGGAQGGCFKSPASLSYTMCE